MSLKDLLKMKSTSKDKVREKLENDLQKQSMLIAKSILFRKCKPKYIDDLEKKYKVYFAKYPNVKDELHVKQQIAKMRVIVA